MSRRGRPDKQIVGLRFDTAWCPRHLSPLDGEPPAVGIAAMGFLLTAFVSHPMIQQETGGGHVLKVGPSLERHSPLCCFLGDDAVSAVIDDALAAGR